MKPRDYQVFARDEIFRYFDEGGKGNPVVAMPTGTGKSVVIADFVAEVFRRYAGQRIVKLTHVKELIQQNYDKLRTLWPTAPAGIYSAGLGRREFYSPIVFAGIASAIKVAADFGHVDLLLIDECHLVSPKEGTMYQTFVQILKITNPFLKVIGFTATHFRLGQGALTEEGGLFTDVVVDLTTFDNFNWFLDEGYLVPLIPKRTGIELDVDGVKVQQGEYNLKQLQAKVDRREVTVAALREAVVQGADRNHWLLFASGIEHAEHCCVELNEMGVPSTVIHSRLDSVERDQRLRDYKDGRYRCMCNNGILTTGFDFPAMDMIVMLRPTVSPGLWVQMLGRGTRPNYAPGFDLETTLGRLQAIAQSAKQNCLVLDFAGNTRRLGPINDPVTPRKRGKGNGQAPIKTCEACGMYNHASARFCKLCGAEFHIQTKFKATASTDALIKRREADVPNIVSIPVDHIEYKEHRSAKGNSLKVMYHCGYRVFNEWVCFEHASYAKHRAHDWWREHSRTMPPETVMEAFKRLGELRQPKAIKVWVNTKYPEVRGHEF